LEKFHRAPFFAPFQFEISPALLVRQRAEPFAPSAGCGGISKMGEILPYTFGFWNPWFYRGKRCAEPFTAGAGQSGMMKNE